MINPTSATTMGTPLPSSPPSAAGSALASDFETFLQMLTAQARYQDPLEPMDNSEYAAQLAQFSMVEQQVQTNDLLTALGSSNMAQMANWIGMEARTTAPVQFDGSPITVNPNPVAVADEVFLVVRDNNGAEVQRTSIPVSADPIQWAGVTSDGTPFPDGVYSFQIESHQDGKLLLTDPAETYARVTEALMQGADTILVLEGGSAVLASSVTGLREAPSAI